MTAHTLPDKFSDLEPWADKWCLATEAERYSTRLASTMEELQAFYDALVPRAEDAISYCDQFPLDDMPEDAVKLMHLLYSLIAVSFAVEAWGQPRIPDSGAAYLDLITEPGP